MFAQGQPSLFSFDAAAPKCDKPYDACHSGCLARDHGYSMSLSEYSTDAGDGRSSLPSSASSLGSVMSMPASEISFDRFETEARYLDQVARLDCGAPAPEQQAAWSAEESCLSPEAATSSDDSRDDAMIIFDWDDTILPSSALASALPGFPTAAPSGAIAEELRTHAASVWSLLRAARSVARVAIVTSSSVGWVQESAARYLLDLDFEALCLELDIQVYYSGDLEQTGAEDPVILKRDAMVQALTSLPSGADEEAGIARLNAISVGDSAVSAAALRELLGSWGASGLLAFAPLCKTVKLLSSPTVAALGDELDRLVVWLEHMAISESEFDLCVSKPEEVTTKALHLFSA